MRPVAADRDSRSAGSGPMPGVATPSQPAERAASRGGVIRAAFALVVTALAVWFLWRVLSDVGLVALGSRLRSASLGLTVAALFVTVLRFVTLALRWEILARREAPVG